jgi:dihydroorotate dehydrogenase
MENLQFYLEKGLEIFGAAVALASLIVKLTPSTKDDAILAKVVKVLDFLSIFNTKINQAKIDGTAVVENKGVVK